MIAIFISIICLIYVKEDSLVYVFEIVRHGAREPVDHSTKMSGMLTPMGMRQRFLLGRYNAELYSDSINPDKHTNAKSHGIMDSTDVFRTIQSGYSELMGMSYFKRIQ